MCDALAREESCGGHFREEYQTGGEAQRDDETSAATVGSTWVLVKNLRDTLRNLNTKMLSLLQGVTNNEINSTRLASKDENDKGKMVQYSKGCLS